MGVCTCCVAATVAVASLLSEQVRGRVGRKNIEREKNEIRGPMGCGCGGGVSPPKTMRSRRGAVGVAAENPLLY